MNVDPRGFWEEKILRWEADRYGEGSPGAGWLERLARRASRSLRARQAAAREILAGQVEGRRVVELGCGSGLLAEALIEAGAASYLGLDIARNAVEGARERTQSSPHSGRIRFEVADVSARPRLDADLVFSLGLFDWLTLPQIEGVFAASGDSEYLHAIAEKRVSLSQYVHRAYVFLSYGHRTGGYVPQYYSAAAIAVRAAPHNPRPVHVFRSPSISFGALVTTLPLPR
jgi:SAM-dependent methyltransferase